MIINSKIEIKKTDKNDLQTWAELRRMLWPSATLEQHKREIKELESDRFHSWFALSENVKIGFAEVYIRQFANGCDSRPVVFLEGIWVGDQYRQKGVGRLLVTEISNWSRVNGFTEIGSDVEIDNTISNISHIKWGFEEMERVVYYRKKI